MLVTLYVHKWALVFCGRSDPFFASKSYPCILDYTWYLNESQRISHSVAFLLTSLPLDLSRRVTCYTQSVNIQTLLWLQEAIYMYCKKQQSLCTRVTIWDSCFLLADMTLVMNRPRPRIATLFVQSVDLVLRRRSKTIPMHPPLWLTGWVLQAVSTGDTLPTHYHIADSTTKPLLTSINMQF